MATFDPSSPGPKGIYYFDERGVISVAHVDLETGEMTEFENPAEHTHRTEMTGQQLLDRWHELQEHGYTSFTHPVRDEELLVGHDGELIEANSIVPPKRDER